MSGPPTTAPGSPSAPLHRLGGDAPCPGLNNAKVCAQITLAPRSILSSTALYCSLNYFRSCHFTARVARAFGAAWQIGFVSASSAALLGRPYFSLSPSFLRPPLLPTVQLVSELQEDFHNIATSPQPVHRSPQAPASCPLTSGPPTFPSLRDHLH